MIMAIIVINTTETVTAIYYNILIPIMAILRTNPKAPQPDTQNNTNYRITKTTLLSALNYRPHP